MAFLLRTGAHPLSFALSLALPLAIGACGDDGDDTVGATVGATMGTTEAGSTSEESSSSGSTGVPFEPYAARGVTITRVEANPGVAVPIGLDGGAVAGPDRNAFILPNRNTLVRIYLDVPDDWVTRELEARLTLIHDDGTTEEFSDVFEISEDTRDSGIKTGPYFGLDAPSMRVNVKYKVSLWETEWGYEDLAEPDPPPILPVDGSAAYIGVEDTYLNMRLVLVPIDYSYDTCERLVDGEEIRKEFDNALYQQNPLETLEMEIREPYKVTYDMGEYSGLNKLVNDMSQLRAADGADPEVYYYGIFDNCGYCIGDGGLGGGCTVGLAANITGGSKSDAWARASAGQLNNGSAATFVHEVGHTQGRRHIKCPSAGVTAAGTDPSYPYENGVINVWGFGIRDFGLRHPTASSDYMSYCSQTWVSDWQWNATKKRIETLSSWEGDDAGAVADEPGLLIGAIAPDGSEDWWTVPGSFDGAVTRSATDSLRFTHGGEIIESAAQVSVRPHYPTTNIVAELPADFDLELGEIRYLHGEDERVVTVAPEKIFHRPDRLRAP